MIPFGYVSPSASLPTTLYIGIPEATATALGVLLGNNNGTFASQTTYTSGGAGGVNRIRPCDLNGDGTIDLLTANSSVAAVSVLLGNSNGTFAAQMTRTCPGLAVGVAVADINGDGKADLITPGQVSKVSVLLGNANGTFAAATNLNIATNYTCQFVAIGDLNGDGKPDIVAGAYNYNNSYSYSCVSTLLGNNDGTFAAHVDKNVQQTFGSSAQQGLFWGILADTRGTGVQDLIIPCAGDQTKISVLLGNGNGTFAAAVNYGTGTRPDKGGCAVADIDGDGDIDIVTADYTTSTVSVLLGNGNGTFGTKTTYACFTNPTGIALADTTGDNKLDILVSGKSTGVSVLLGNGNGIFQAAVNTSFTGTAWGIQPFRPTSGITHIQTDGSAATSPATTITKSQTSSPTAADMILVAVAGSAVAATPTFTITDTLGNTYASIGRSTSGFLATEVFRCASCLSTGANTVTATANTSSTMSIGVSQYRASKTIVVDTAVKRSGGVASAFGIQGPWLNQPMELVYVAAGTLGNAGVITSPTAQGFTERYNAGNTVNANDLSVSDITSAGCVPYPQFAVTIATAAWAGVTVSLRKTP